MARTAIDVTQEPLDDGVLIAVRGDIDYGNSPELRSHLLEALDGRPQRLIVDLEGVPYMDSSGVATLVEALQAQMKADRQIVLCHLQPKVQSILQIVRLDLMFTIVDDLEQARRV